MEYRTILHTGARVSVLGMGSAVIGAQPEAEIIRTVQAACDAGINFFDMAGGHATIFPAYGKALAGRRDQVYLQVHFGADYTSGEYGWTTDLRQIQHAVAWQLEHLQTDYIDFGMIHCLDEASDLAAYRESGVLDYLLDCKARGIVRHIGLSSHTPALANAVLDLGLADILLFSINPVYDYGRGKYGHGAHEERRALYSRCQREGVAISVMKPFCGGQLLDAAQSPFGVALTKAQCLQYALDQPGVATVVPGYGSLQELQEVLAFFSATPEERDYSCISSFAPASAVGRCVYCKHCHPCPVGLDIALINKYSDLARQGDRLAAGHYQALAHHASDCLACGHCDRRCPFHVAQSEQMQDIAAYFGV